MPCVASLRSEIRTLPQPVASVLADWMSVFTHRVCLVVCHHQVDFDHGQEIKGVLLAAVVFLMPVLPAKSPYFTGGHLINANFLLGFLHLIQLEKWNGGFNHFPAFILSAKSHARVSSTKSLQSA